MTLERQRRALERIVKSPQTVLLAGFAGVIFLGAVILRLPWSHQPGKVTFVDALFTSTSAVCVTGLAVVDTGTDYTFFGQVVILLLIQIGGLGVMTFASLTFQLVGRRLSLQSTAVLHDSFLQRDFGEEFGRTFKMILVITAAIEGAGALLLFLFLLPRMEAPDAAFSAVFHAVSAFCNAGFSLRSDNLVGLRDSAGILFVIMALIVLGGIGYTVLIEIWDWWRKRSRRERSMRPRHFSLHARLVFRVTAILIVGGTVFLLIFGLTPQEKSWDEMILNSLFQSVTARTAGFNSVDIGLMPGASLFTLIVLMFIGGSPGSCAGGIKTTSMAIWTARLMAVLRNKREISIMERRIPDELIGRTDLLMGLAVLWNVVGILFLFTMERQLPVDTLELIFEQVSAFGTVGLSTGVTPDLSDAGKLWLSATMYVGRVGALTIAVWMIPQSDVHVHFPKGTVMVG